MKRSLIDNPRLANAGAEQCNWFNGKMPAMKALKERFIKTRPLTGKDIVICMHIEPKTAVWIDALLSGGAREISLIGCVGTTQAATAAFLASKRNVCVLGREDDTLGTQKKYIQQALNSKKDIILDNGGSVIVEWHKGKYNWAPLGATEETKSGKNQIEAKVQSPELPIVVIDDSPLKKTLENTIGVGQSVVDGILRATSLLLGGKRVLVIGYGWCGRGIASRLRGLGAITLVHDINPVKLLQAKMEGNIVASCENLLPQADIIVTVTGEENVLTKRHFAKMKSGAVLCNAGHFSNEINLRDLKQDFKKEKIRAGIDAYSTGRKTIYLLENADLINLSAADGNPIEIMDMGLSLQALSAAAIADRKKPLARGIQPVPEHINRDLAELCLRLY